MGIKWIFDLARHNFVFRIGWMFSELRFRCAVKHKLSAHSGLYYMFIYFIQRFICLWSFSKVCPVSNCMDIRLAVLGLRANRRHGDTTKIRGAFFVQIFLANVPPPLTLRNEIMERCCKLESSLQSNWILVMLATAQSRIYCLLVCRQKSQQLQYTEL